MELSKLFIDQYGFLHCDFNLVPSMTKFVIDGVFENDYGTFFKINKNHISE